MTDIEFHFDFGSPNAYLAHLVIPQIEARLGIKFEYVPVLLGGVFKATNNVSPGESLKGIINKPEYSQIETRRFVTAYGIETYHPNPYFPVNTLGIMRGAVYAQKAGFFESYVNEVYRYMWREARKMDDIEVILASLTESGLPAEDIIAGTGDPLIKQKLIENTNNSVARGTFGSPTFFVGKEIFFGKDKLRDLEEEIAKQQ